MSTQSEHNMCFAIIACFDRKHKHGVKTKYMTQQLMQKSPETKQSETKTTTKNQTNQHKWNEWGQCGKWIFTFLTIFTTMIHHKNIKHWKHDSLQTLNTASYLLHASLLYKCSFLRSTTCYILGLLEKLSLLISSYLDLAVSETSLNYNYPVSKFPTRHCFWQRDNGMKLPQGWEASADKLHAPSLVQRAHYIKLVHPITSIINTNII